MMCGPDAGYRFAAGDFPGRPIRLPRVGGDQQCMSGGDNIGDRLHPSGALQNKQRRYKGEDILYSIRPARFHAPSIIFIIFVVFIFFQNNAWSQVDEIVVTARKMEESLQDVPISVTAFSSQDIDRKGIVNISDVARLTPSIQFDESFAQSDTRIVVRGLSPTRGRQNIALLLDGIDVSSEAVTSSGGSLLLNTRLVDIERIEVVLGPQMALYGRSAFNGAIQYITKDPSETLETVVKFDVAEDARYSLTGSVSAPLVGEALGFRLNGTWWDEEGFYENSITGKKVGGDKGYGLALTFDSKIGDSLSFKFRTEYTDDEGQPSPQAFLPFNTELAVPLEATELIVDANGNRVSSGISECFNGQNGFPDFIGALSAGVPGNDDALQGRTDRITATNFNSQVAGSELADFLGGSINGVPADPTIATGGISPYCEWVHPSVAGKVPSADNLIVALAPNPATPGVDYEGFDRELFRTSLVAEWSLENFTFASLTGFTRDENIEAQDSNAYAFHSADAGPFLDGNVNSFSSNNGKVTEQFSQELRFSTNFEGRVNGTIGGLYWSEKVENDAMSVTGQASGSHCMWDSNSGLLNPLGIDDGCTGFTSAPVAPYLNAGAQFRGSSPVDRDTEHWSAYGVLDIELTERWTLTLEGRYNDEEVDVFGPIFFDPGASGGPGGLNPCGIFFRACQQFDDWVADGNWFSDSYFPFTDEGPNGEDLTQFVLDQELIDSIPTLCLEQSSDAITRSIREGPTEIAWDDVNNVPVWSNGPEAEADNTVVIKDAEGRAVLNPNATDTFNPWCVDSLSDTDSWFSPKVTLDWAPTDDSLVYFSWSRARKPGGFGLLTVGSSGLDRDLTEFEPEIMEVFELGANTAWLDNTLIANGAFFFQDFTDKQALTSALGNDGRLVSKIENAGSAEVWGAELSLVWQPIAEFLGGGWRLGGAYTFLDTEYTDFTVNSGSSVNAAGAGNCTPTVVGDANLCTLSYTGNKLEDAPEGAFNGSAEFARPISAEVDAFIETDIQWQDKRFTGVTNNVWTDAYWNFDLRLGMRSDRFEATLYVDNLLDNDTVRFTGGGPGLGCCFVLGSSIDLSASDGDPDAVPAEPPVPAVPSAAVMVDLPLFSTAFLPDPRVIGVRWSYRFGD
jgi:outer membrane receptor protein involved in Fe transport